MMIRDSKTQLKNHPKKRKYVKLSTKNNFKEIIHWLIDNDVLKVCLFYIVLCENPSTE